MYYYLLLEVLDEDTLLDDRPLLDLLEDFRIVFELLGFMDLELLTDVLRVDLFGLTVLVFLIDVLRVDLFGLTVLVFLIDVLRVDLFGLTVLVFLIDVLRVDLFGLTVLVFLIEEVLVALVFRVATLLVFPFLIAVFLVVLAIL